MYMYSGNLIFTSSNNANIAKIYHSTLCEILNSQPTDFDPDDIGSFRHDWATSYYDTEDGICVHVNADVLRKEEAAQEIDKQFPLLKNVWSCELVETNPGTCQTISQTAD